MTFVTACPKTNHDNAGLSLWLSYPCHVEIPAWYDGRRREG
jgi:hypothetical protein